MKPTILIILSLLVICLTCNHANGCLQPAGRYQVGKPIKVEGLSAQDFARDLVSHEDLTYWEKVKADIEKQKKVYPFMDNRNNLAVALIHLGQVKEAITIYRRIGKKIEPTICDSCEFRYSL